MEGITDALRRELQTFGISVSLLEPAYVKSRIAHKVYDNKPFFGASPAEYDLYRGVFDGFFTYDRRMSLSQSSDTPATTTTPAILDAILSPTPQTRYPCATVDGSPSWFVAMLQRLLPDRVMDALMHSGHEAANKAARDGMSNALPTSSSSRD